MQKGDILRQRTCYMQLKCHFAVAGPSAWIDAPPHVKQAPTLISFKAKVCVVHRMLFVTVSHFYIFSTDAQHYLIADQKHCSVLEGTYATPWSCISWPQYYYYFLFYIIYYYYYYYYNYFNCIQYNIYTPTCQKYPGSSKI